MVHPMPIPAPYPMITPPPTDWAYRTGRLGSLTLNSPAPSAAAKEPKNIPNTRNNIWLKKSPSEGTRTQPGSDSTPARGPGATSTIEAIAIDQRDTSPVNPQGSLAVNSRTLRPPSTAPAGSTGHP